MTRRFKTASLAVVLVSVLAFAAGNPLIGTWKLNLAKSKFVNAQPLQSRTDKYAPYGKDGFKYSSDEVNAKGETRHTSYEAQFDGKDYPLKGSPQAGDSVAIKRIDAHTFESSFKKDGKPNGASRRVISPDGKTMTFTQGNGTVQVFDKQ
jgi:hypothetical protein